MEPTSKPHPDRLVVTVPEAAALLGVSRALGYALVANGQVPSVRLGRRIVIPWRALEAFLEETTRRFSPSEHPSGQDPNSPKRSA
jgi:excisionase family DNA binding protein